MSVESASTLGAAASPPRDDLGLAEDFERNRCGFFAADYARSAVYWSSLCDVMEANDGSTQQVLTFIADRLETDRAYSAAVYANADKVFGDKKGTSKLRHDKIRHHEQKKTKGEDIVSSAAAMLAGGPDKDQPDNDTIRAVWEMAEMDCRAARLRDTLCDELEQGELLGKVKMMSKEMRRRSKELSDQGDEADACLLSLRNIDKRVGLSFLHLKETLGSQIGGTPIHEDTWFLDCSYRTAVVHQKEAWEVVTAQLWEIFDKMKDLEAERRDTLRTFMISANVAVEESWSKLPAICGPATNSAHAVSATDEEIDQEVTASAAAGVDEKEKEEEKEEEVKTPRVECQLPNTTNSAYADPPPSDMSFIDSLSAPLDSPLVRAMMMVERREGNALRSSYYPGLLVLSWDGFLHLFDVPHNSGLKVDISPSAAFQGISPTISLDDLVANKKDLEEVLMFKSTVTLELDEDSTVEAVTSHKSHKDHKLVKVKGTAQFKSVFRPSSGSKTIIFCTGTEAEMNNAVEVIKESIQGSGGMSDPSDPQSSRASAGSRPSFGSNQGQLNKPAEEAEAPAPLPVPVPDSTPAPAATVRSELEAPALESPTAPKESDAPAPEPAEGANDAAGASTADVSVEA